MRESRAPELDPMAHVLDRLVQAATRAREQAYAPYSKYRVGAAVASDSGLIYAGCNVENAAYPAGIVRARCARLHGRRRGPKADRVRGGHEGDPAVPGGMRRQTLVEFARSMPIVLVGLGRNGQGLQDSGALVLLPDAFKLARPKR